MGYLGKMNFKRELFYSYELAAVGEGDSLAVKAAVSAVGSAVVNVFSVKLYYVFLYAIIKEKHKKGDP